MNKPDINQHYVPQFYLKRWAHNKSGLLSEFDKHTLKCSRRPSKQLASSPYFYEFTQVVVGNPDIAAERKTLEIWAAAEESAGARLFQKLLGPGVDPVTLLSDLKFRNSVCRYLAFQFIRSPGTRLTVSDPRSSRAEQMINCFLAESGSDVRFKQLTNREKRELVTQDFRKLLHMKLMVDEINAVQRMFFSLSPVIWVRSDRANSALVTSDFPIVGDDHACPPDRTNFAFPLSPDVLLYLTSVRDGEAIRHMSSDDISRFNELQLQQCWRFVYSRLAGESEIQSVARANPDWCKTEEQIFMQEQASRLKNEHWNSLPGVLN